MPDPAAPPPESNRPGWRANALLFCGSLVFSLLVAEAAARIAYPAFANYNLEMWRYFATFKQLRASEDLPFVMHPSRAAHLYGVDVSTNALGLRDREVAPEKTPGVPRIAVIGDSQTFGWGVPQDQTISRFLEAQLIERGTPVETINFGVGNFNSLMIAEHFELKALPLDPDLVVLNYFINDAEPTPYINPWLFHISRFSYLYAIGFDRYINWRTSLDEDFTWLDYYSSLYTPDNPYLERNRAALDRLLETCKEKDIPILVASYPDLHELKDYPLEAATEYIREIAERHEVPFVDLRPDLAEHSPESLWVSFEDPHGNPTATSTIARTLADALAEFGMLDAAP